MNTSSTAFEPLMATDCERRGVVGTQDPNLSKQRMNSPVLSVRHDGRVTQARPRPRDPRPLRRILHSVRNGLVWGVAAAAFSVVFCGLAGLAGIPLEVVPTDSVGPVSLGPLVLIAATLFAAALAGLATGFLGRLVRRPIPWIIAGGVVITLASLSAPLNPSDPMPASTRAILVICHCVTGALVTYGLARGMVSDDRSAL